jgi:hypothetical protein
MSFAMPELRLLMGISLSPYLSLSCVRIFEYQVVLSLTFDAVVLQTR